ncbi:MAG: redox-regulated ATPase YchF [Ignavibacteria bacterium RBG_13_36_8]|nr:MAG: redox-regulated ATPase YchF [Ignavibacteria bacterium RBG_13_36_8]
MQIGLVGLQYSGKTTLLNAVTKTESIQSGKDEANIEVVKIPDERLDKLTDILKPPKKVNATIEVFDFPGLRMSDDGKVKMSPSFLKNVQDNDALFYVIRQFRDDTVPHPLSDIDPIRDINFLNTEFQLYDLGFFEDRLEKLRKDIMRSTDESLKKELPVIEKCLTHLEKEEPLRLLHLEENEKKMLAGYQIFTLKPLVVAVNFDEDSISKVDEIIAKIKNEIKFGDVQVIPFFAKIEHELSQLDENDRKSFMDDYGIKESAQSKILRTLYDVLGLLSFFTYNDNECRAWTLRKNSNVHEAARVIHTDFYNRFIRAEVVHFDDFIKHGSFAKCKEAGVWHLEGKEYIVNDGDIILIRHN